MAKWRAAGQDSHVTIGNKKNKNKNKKKKKQKKKKITNRGNLDNSNFYMSMSRGTAKRSQGHS